MNQIIHLKNSSTCLKYGNWFSILPLQIATYLGLGYQFLIIDSSFVLGRYFIEGSPVPGFFSRFNNINFSGAQLLATGIIGEYLAAFLDVDKPQYFIKKIEN